MLFLQPDFDHKAVMTNLSPVAGVDDVVFVPGALLWHVKRSCQSKSRMQKGFIGSQLYKHITARNVNTVRKLADLLAG